MKAVVMAGGEGTRLRPLTSLRPKPMVPVVNQPVMEHILGLVKHHGMTEVVATLAFMPQVIEDYFGDGDEWGMDISYAIEETPLGTAGSVRNAADALTEPFVVISGDALTDIDLTKVIEFHRSRDAAVTIALKRVPNPLEFGVVITDEDGKIERFLEKPSWGQVFSDTINTGIYVVDPLVFEYIPEGRPFDFSSEVFPLLMSEGHDLYGCVVDGYWCDVGSLESYIEVHRDILDGKAMLYVPGSRTKDSVWLGHGSEVDPSAQLSSKVVVGANTRIRAGAVLGPYTIVGDNCLIGADAQTEHSIIWNDSFVGTRSQVRGAVLCRSVDIRAGARVEQGAVIGDETMVGRGATVGNDVQVYPYKRIDAGAIVNSSIIWESRGVRSLFGEDGVRGLVNIDITPELTLRLSQAFGSLLPNKCHVVVSRDSSRAGRMVKRAVAAGLNSTGCHVRDLRVASPAVTRFTTRDTRALGGVHVCAADNDPQTLEIHFYNEAGIDLSTGLEKKVERLHFRQEFRRAFFEEIGEMIYPPRALEYYTAALSTALDEAGQVERRFKVVADLGMSPASFVLPNVAADWGIELISMRAYVDSERPREDTTVRDALIGQLSRSVDVFEADLGISMDSTAERITLVTGNGNVLDHDSALHAMAWMWCHADICDDGRQGMAVSVTASSAIDEIARGCGREVKRTGASRRALLAAASEPAIGFAGSRDGGYAFPCFLAAYDAMMSFGMTLRLLDHHKMTLDQVVAELPAFHMRHEAVFCPFDRKGAVMRTMAAIGQTGEAQIVEGVRIPTDDGWALVLPHSTEALVNVYAEGVSEDTADATIARYVDEVREAIANG
ncbi:MAG: NTP transferase domain-containing protein [Coriobacteriia bacterium]|nr:NTP transferase domain-containing protein [Coriobacteriia bacterium]